MLQATQAIVIKLLNIGFFLFLVRDKLYQLLYIGWVVELQTSLTDMAANQFKIGQIKKWRPTNTKNT